MGGTSSTTQQGQQTQQSQVTPYAPAQAGLSGILGNLAPSVANLNGTPQTNQAFQTIENNSQGPNPYSPAIGGVANSQLGGGANYGASTGILGNAYGNLQTQLAPYTSGSATDPNSNPALAQQLQTVNQQVSDTVNPQFSAAGRLGSPDNAKAMGMGIAQGDTGILQNAQSNQLNAIGQLFGGAGSTASGLNSADANNATIQNSGVTNAGNAITAQNQPATNLLSAALAQQQLPIQNAGLLSSIYGGLGAQFGQTNASGTTSQQGTATASPMQQLLMGTQAFSNLLNPFKSSAGLALPS